MKLKATISGMLICIMLPGAVAVAQEAEPGTTVIETEGGKVYRQIGPDGEVLYSDKPLSEQAEPVQVPKTPTYDAQPVPRFEPYKEPDSQQQADPYATLKVTYPGEDQVIWDNTGTMRVSVAVDPPLRGDHQLQILFNGEVRYTGSSTDVTLTEVWRNTYKVVPQVVNAQGEVVTTGEGVTFHMKQHSAKN
jgi:hypothetical protein